MSTPKFHNKNGDVSAYAFACGYIQNEENETRWKHIYKEHVHWHVKKGAIQNGEHVIYDVWETFEINELTKARKLYKSL
jgi:hypothetical protein